MSRLMSPDECRAFLTHGTRTGKLGTRRPDGWPHVTPIWFVLDGGDLVFTTGATSVKARAMRRDDRVCLCVDDERPPFAYVRVEGRVTFSHDLGETLRYATAIGGRYMGADRAHEFGRRNAVPGEVLVRLTPTQVTGEAEIAS